MRSLLPAVACLLFACNGPAVAPVQPSSPCEQRAFEGTSFTVCALKGGRPEVLTSDRNGTPYRSFAAVEAALGPKAERVAFGMNAGMFDANGHAIGLLIERGKELHAINRRKGGGNFHLLPNGLFLVRKDGSAEVVATDAFKPAASIDYATQSGPMLVIEGKLHPSFDADGTSRYIRNGIGIAPGGTPLFVISNEEVSFGKLARFFRDGLRTRNALYFDGSVSSLWDPANGRRDGFVPIGPMVVVFRPSESKPGRASRATP
ncbi:MAG: phosphodiester glycosidase family protein [Sphingomicrobium sp.]